MQIVIDIDEETLQDLYDSRYVSSHIKDVFRSATPLPKGHGRLIDADKIQFENNEFETYNDYSEAFNAIYFAPTIIEADRSKEE